MKDEPQFVHVANRPTAAPVSESRWQPLYKAEPRITGSQTQLVSDYISAILTGAAETRDLREQIAALELLKDVPTARLERVLAEHVDTASYRIDAWQLALVRYQLETMRYDRGGNEDGGSGSPRAVRRRLRMAGEPARRRRGRPSRWTWTTSSPPFSTDPTIRR